MFKPKNWCITFDGTEIPFTRSESEAGSWNLFKVQRPALSEHSIRQLRVQNYKAKKDKIEGKSK